MDPKDPKDWLHRYEKKVLEYQFMSLVNDICKCRKAICIYCEHKENKSA